MPLSEDLMSPRMYPLGLDGGRRLVRLIELEETDYRAAGFLDNHHLKQFGAGFWVDWMEVERATETMPAQCDFIFHIGHVGSTLLSRLLGVNEQVFCLREPEILRALARSEFAIGDGRVVVDGASFDRISEVFVKLLSRVWRPGQRSLIKTTSYVSDMAPLLMQLSPDAKALLLVATPTQYAATVFRTEIPRDDIRSAARERLARLHMRLPERAWRLEDLSEGEVVAMSWLCGIMALSEIARTFPERASWIDFDAFLQQPEGILATSLRHLGGASSEQEIEQIIRSPDWGRYSKDQRFPFGPDSRRRALADSMAGHAAEIASGAAWIEGARRRFTEIDEVLNSVETVYGAA